MTYEEFKEQRRKATEIKKEIPQIFNDVLGYYERFKMQEIKNSCKLDTLYYELENVKGIDYAKQRNTYNNDARIEKYYKISDEISQLEKENGFIESILKGLEYIRDSVADASLRTKINESYFKTYM